MIEDDHLYDELKRRVDFQIEENRHLESQAGRFLRIWLVVMGGLLTVGLSIASGRINSPSSENTASPESLAEFLPLINENLANLVLLFTLLTSVILLGMSIGAIFFSAPLSCLRVLRLSPMEPNPFIETSDIQDKEFLRDLISEYENQVEENKEMLDEVRENWQLCIESITRGVKYIVVSGFTLIVLFIAYDDLFALLSIILLSYMVGVAIYRKSDNFRPYLVWNGTVDLVHIGMTLIGIVGIILVEYRNGPDFLLLAPAIFVLAILPYLSNLEQELIRRLSGRTLGIFLLSVLMFLLIGNSLPTFEESIYGEILVYVSFGASISSLFLFSVLFTTYLLNRLTVTVHRYTNKEYMGKILEFIQR